MRPRRGARGQAPGSAVGSSCTDAGESRLPPSPSTLLVALKCGALVSGRFQASGSGACRDTGGVRINLGAADVQDRFHMLLIRARCFVCYSQVRKRDRYLLPLACQYDGVAPRGDAIVRGLTGRMDDVFVTTGASHSWRHVSWTTHGATFELEVNARRTTFGGVHGAVSRVWQDPFFALVSGSQHVCSAVKQS